jgi:hypothetical protein
MILCMYRKIISSMTIFLLLLVTMLPAYGGNWITFTGITQHTMQQNKQSVEETNGAGDFFSFYESSPGFHGFTNVDYNPGDLNTSFFNITEIAEFGQTVWGLTSADFNNDGFIDFAVSWATAPWRISMISLFYRNYNNDINFTQVDVFPIRDLLRYVTDLDSGDYDNDGDIDLLYTCNEIWWDQGLPFNANGTVNLLENDGKNGFSSQRMVARFVAQGPWDPECEINPQLASADYDNDGDIDFLVGSGSGKVKLFMNDGTGNFACSGIIYDYGFDTLGIASGDFNNDGWMDFIVVPEGREENNTFRGNIYLHWNEGPPYYFDQKEGEIIVDLPIPNKFRSIGGGMVGCLITLDYNDDGWLDFLYANSNILSLIVKKGEEFKPFYVCQFPDGPEGYTESLALGALTVADYNNDGLDDLITGGVQGFVRLFVNTHTLIDIVRPKDMWWYLFDEEQYRCYKYSGNSLAIGDICVVAEGLEPLSKVEFYVDGRLMETDIDPAYVWQWDRFSFRKHTVSVIAYDADERYGGTDKMSVTKLF